MRLGPHVNHKEPLEAFLATLNGNSIHLITIIAPSGKGKSRFIRRLVEECEAKGFSQLFALIDFRDNPEYSYADVADEIRQQFKKFNFAIFQRVLKDRLRSARPEIVLRDNVFTQTEVGDIIASLDPETKQLLQQRLSRALLDDLEGIAKKHRLIVMFDTYEKASDDVKKWIAGSFLKSVRSIPNVIVVIAGQTIPDLNSPHYASCAKRFDLYDLTFDDWYEYARLTGAIIRLSEQLLREYYGYYHGDPQSLCMICDPFIGVVN